ncbi:hypothetical protein NDU88_006582 [Pleurodeles waltl]|uniref:Uncharacterized protein n=1 Tax=Pleurodeles waltl TaxID=8319 RepID=A0AAV7NSD0_PLEWA|nr:hypothetical protein NDU88_006582 [Pleurodeles waltl]
MQSSQDHDNYPNLSPGEGSSQWALPPEVDHLLTQAISRALGPLKDSVARLSQHVFKGTGTFGGTGADHKGTAAPKKIRKHDAGHLEGFSILTEAFRKSARTLKRPPFWEGSEPGETGEVVHLIPDPDHGSPKRVEGDTEGDISSEEDQDWGRIWRPTSNLSDSQGAEDSKSEMFQPEAIYHPSL